jgi:acetyl-CoA carboxylase biotin carboxyl carrier protein
MKKPRAPRAAPKTAPRERAPTYDDLIAIARLVEAGSRFTEFRLRSGDIEVEVKRANGAVAPASAGAQVRSSSETAPQQTLPQPPPKGGGTTVPDLPAGTHLIKSPMVGTFYRAAEPGAKPFVEPGQRVKPDTIVCIIEVMKLMNSVEAGIAGTVTHVFAENAAMVEAGQPLIAIRK